MTWLRAPGAEDDKRSMGVVGVVTGSERYPGAAVLGVEAAWRTGAGMVRLWAPRRVQDLVLARRPETVCHALHEAPADVRAWVLGSGQDARERGPALRSLLLEALGSGAPCVVDAGALDLAARHAGPVVATPHAAELRRSLAGLGIDEDDERMRAARLADALGAVVVEKGAATRVVAPGGRSATVQAPTHRLATAGTGDVLAGLLGAMLAARADDAADPATLARIAAEGVELHGEAAAAAAAGGRPITALDVAEHLPGAVAARLSR